MELRGQSRESGNDGGRDGTWAACLECCLSVVLLFLHARFHHQVAMSQRTRSVDGKLTSLVDLGYTYAGLDEGWAACGKGVNRSFHDAQGRPLINDKFPDMASDCARTGSSDNSHWCCLTTTRLRW